MFDILGERTVGARVLDLFAGTGALGLEALSRGADAAVLVESALPAFAVLRGNVAELEAGGAELIRTDWRSALRVLRARGSRFDLLFLDPPYGKGVTARAAAGVAGADLLDPGGTVVVEEASKAGDARFPADWRLIDDRRYGDTRVMIFRVREEPA